MIDFPQFMNLLPDGYSETYKAQVIRSDFEAGIPRQRARASATIKTRSTRYSICGHDNLNCFFDWFRGDIDFGSQWFLWPDPRKNGEKVKARILNKDITINPVSNKFETWTIDLSIESMVS